MFEQGMCRFTGIRGKCRLHSIYFVILFSGNVWFRLYIADPSVSCGQIGLEIAALHYVLQNVHRQF